MPALQSLAIAFFSPSLSIIPLRFLITHDIPQENVTSKVILYVKIHDFFGQPREWSKPYPVHHLRPAKIANIEKISFCSFENGVDSFPTRYIIIKEASLVP